MQLDIKGIWTQQSEADKENIGFSSTHNAVNSYFLLHSKQSSELW